MGPTQKKLCTAQYRKRDLEMRRQNTIASPIMTNMAGEDRPLMVNEVAESAFAHSLKSAESQRPQILARRSARWARRAAY